MAVLSLNQRVKIAQYLISTMGQVIFGLAATQQALREPADPILWAISKQLFNFVGSINSNIIESLVRLYSLPLQE